MKKEKIKNFFYLFFFLFILWVCLVSNVKTQELLTGLFVSFLLAVVLNNFYLRLGLPPLTPKRIFFFIMYLFILLKEIVKANLDVAYRVIHPRMPIKPGIVVIKTGLKQDIGKLMLANSITLTPGTFTLDILEDTLLIHWIDVKTEDMKKNTELIGGRFEKYLRVIFE